MKNCASRPLLWLALLFAAVAGFRIGGASDLHQNLDQTRSMAFTADVALNRRWILPRDTTGEAARKPPLINWIGAIFPRLGLWHEWALKFPSILGGVLATGFCFGAARRIAVADERVSDDAVWFAAASAALYLACPETIKHIYFLRPDMLNAAWLAGTWFFSLRMFDPNPAVRFRNALGFWICTGLAALTKGTTALIPVLYLPFAAKVMANSWKAIGRPGWWWGVPLAAALFSVWAVPLTLHHGDFVRQVLIGEETLSRMGSEPHWLWKALLTSWKIPYWFCERFLPWSCFTLAALLVIRPTEWFRGGLGPAILWILITLLFFVPVEHRGGSYFMPAYPAAAPLATWFLSRGLRRCSLSLQTVFRLASAVALVLVLHKAFLGDDARRGVGDAVKTFAAAARRQVGNETVVFVNTGLNPVSTLMRRHQAGEIPTEARDDARWAVYSVPETELEAFKQRHDVVLVSRRLERDLDRGRGHYLCLVNQANKP